MHLTGCMSKLSGGKAWISFVKYVVRIWVLQSICVKILSFVVSHVSRKITVNVRRKRKMDDYLDNLVSFLESQVESDEVQTKPVCQVKVKSTEPSQKVIELMANGFFYVRLMWRGATIKQTVCLNVRDAYLLNW